MRLSAPVAVALVALAACTPAVEPPPADAADAGPVEGAWPPRVGARYPDLELVDRQGLTVRLSSFEGKVLLIEPIGMNCPACNAFAGANRPGVGGLRGLQPQAGIPSIEEGIARFAPGVELGDPELAFLLLLLYDYEMQAPDLADAREWWAHFGRSVPHGRVVIPARDLRGPAAYALIPGFQLVDRSFVLRYDSAGHRPTHDLWTELLPALPRLLAAPSAG